MKTQVESGPLLQEDGIWKPVPAIRADKLAEQNLRLDQLARSRLRLLDSISDGVYQVDLAGACTFMNRAAGDMLGYRVGEALGKQLQQLHHSSRFGRFVETPLGVGNSALESEAAQVLAQSVALDQLSKAAEQNFDQPVSKPVEDIFRRTDGSSFHVEWRALPLLEEGQPAGAVVTFRDNTERKRIESRLKAQHAVSRALEEMVSIEAAMPVVLQSIGQSLNFCWGALWQADSKGRVLTLSHSWSVSTLDLADFELSCRRAAFFPGEDLPGQAWKSEEPVWMPEAADAGSAHCAAAAGAGFRSGFALPIRLTNSLFGVLEFFTPDYEALDADLVAVLRLVSSAIGQVIERKYSQRERTRAAAILEAATDFVGVVMDPTGAILSVSRAVEGMLGYTSAELLYRPLSLVIPGYRRNLQENVGSDQFGPGFPSCSLRMRGRRKSGEWMPLQVSLGECVESGSRVIAGILQDITEREYSKEMLERQTEDLRRAEAALRDQSRLVNSVVSSMADGVVVADEQGEIVLANPAADALLDRPSGDWLHTTGLLAQPGYAFLLSDRETVYTGEGMPLERAVRGETVDAEEMFVKTPSRPEGFWLNATARPMWDEEEILRGGVVVLRDITEQKTSREALRQAKVEAETANRAKSEFLSRMSHELRTPMNAILGFGQMLEDEALTVDQRDGVARILKAARHLLGLINEVLDISRIEAGHLNLQIEQLRPYEVMQGALELIGPLAAKRGITLHPPPVSESRWIIHADRQRLTQAFVNLLANAVKYNHEGGQVMVSFEETAAHKLSMNIADTGPGIEASQLKKLFVAFERLGAERSGVEGTGLGLAFSNRLVTAMGGEIVVKSEVGKGSVFSIEIALSAGEGPVGQEAVGVGAGTLSNGSNAAADNQSLLELGLAHVLYIQNDAECLRQIQDVFERLPGYLLVSAQRGDQGIQLARECAPELMLLDLDLPDMDGIAVLRELKAQGGARKVPIVAISDDFTSKRKQSALDAGAHSCIAKPIAMREFLDIVGDLV